MKKTEGLRSTDGQLQNSPGDVKYGIGNTVSNTVITVRCRVGAGNIRGTLCKVHDCLTTMPYT